MRWPAALWILPLLGVAAAGSAAREANAAGPEPVLPPARARVSEARLHLTFVLNCHDHLSPERSAQTIRRIVGMLRARGLRGDFYVTAPLLEAWRAHAPDVIDLLKASGATISYHLRAPHPVCFDSALSRRLRELPGEERVRELRRYETHGWDMTTGRPRRDGLGGYALVKAIFGTPPVATGLNPLDARLREAELRVLRDLGARVNVFFHEGGTDPQAPFRYRDGILERPADFAVARVTRPGLGPAASPDGRQASGRPPRPRRPPFWWNEILRDPAGADPVRLLKEAMARLAPDRIAFAPVLIHETDFYARQAPWQPLFWGPGGRRRPPYPTEPHRAVPLRTPAEQEAIWAHYEALIDYAARNREIAVITSRDLVDMVEPPETTEGVAVARRRPPGRRSWTRPPHRTVNWVTDPSFERKGAEGISIERLEGDRDPRIARVEAGARTGRAALRIDLGPGSRARIAIPVRLDKGRYDRFGGWLRAEGDVRAAFRLDMRPAARRLRPFGPGRPPVPGRHATARLQVGEAWSRLSATTLLSGNVRRSALVLVIEGSGTVWLDDVFVESDELEPAPLPDRPAAPVLAAFLFHIEDVPLLVSRRAYFAGKARVIEDMARLAQRHGARLTLQPELALARGARRHDPDLFRRLRERYGVEVSVHTHGPRGPRPSPRDVAAYVAERKRTFEAMGAGPVTDLNGNFDLEARGALAAVGIRSQTAFKNRHTQLPHGGFYVHPWRPKGASPFTDEIMWAIHDPGGPIVYIPGMCRAATRFAERIRQAVEPSLTRAIARARPDRINTWYFVSHVDFFVPRTAGSLEAYLESDAYRQDLAHYEALFGRLFDPLAARGFIRWSTPSGMREAFEAWEKAHR